MKTINFHRTDSQSWRLLIDGNVHPLLVGFLSLSAAVGKLVRVYDEVGPFSFDSLKELAADLKSKAELWDGDEKYNWDVSNARVLLSCLIVKRYPSESHEEAKDNFRAFNIPAGGSFSGVMQQAPEERREIKGVLLKNDARKEVSSDQLMASKHNPQDEDLIEQIKFINPVNPNLRLTGPHTDKIRWGLVIDDKEGKETWLVGCSYDEEKAKEILASLLALLNKPLEE